MENLAKQGVIFWQGDRVVDDPLGRFQSGNILIPVIVTRALAQERRLYAAKAVGSSPFCRIIAPLNHWCACCAHAGHHHSMCKFAELGFVFWRMADRGNAIRRVPAGSYCRQVEGMPQFSLNGVRWSVQPHFEELPIRQTGYPTTTVDGEWLHEIARPLYITPLTDLLETDLSVRIPLY
jgi:hypothetical protein